MSVSRYILLNKSDLVELIQSIYNNVNSKYATKSLVTKSAAGLMAAADKRKLDDIEENANNYTHPSSAGYKHIPTGGEKDQVLRYLANGTAKWDDEKYEISRLTKDEIDSMVDRIFAE